MTHVELDALFHQPDWTELPADEFRAVVAARLDELPDGWVTCGNYRVVRDVIWEQADTVVWLDLPRRRVMPRVTARTVRRVVTREELWNGNREPWQNLYAWDPERNIVRWAWTQHDKYTEQYVAAMADPRWAGLTLRPPLLAPPDRAVVRGALARTGAAGPGGRVLAVERAQHVVQVGMGLLELIGPIEEGLGGDGEELARD